MTPDEIKAQFRSAGEQLKRKLWREVKILVIGGLSTLIGVTALIVFLVTR